MARFKLQLFPAYVAIEVAIPASVVRGTQIFIRDQPQIRGKSILGVSSVTEAECLLTPSGQAVIDLPGAGGCYLTLTDGNFSFIDNIPLAEFLSLQYFRPFVAFDAKKVNWERSFLTVTDVTQAGKSVLLIVAYIP